MKGPDMTDMEKYDYMRQLIKKHGAVYHQGNSRDRIVFIGEGSHERAENVFNELKEENVNVYGLHKGKYAENGDLYSEFQYR